MGAAVGFIVGLMVTKNLLFALFFAGVGAYILNRVIDFEGAYSDNEQNENLDYIREVLALVSVILTRDKKILQSELNYVKRFLKHNFTEAEAKKYLLIFRDYTKKNLSIDKICVRINRGLNPSGKRQILHLIIGAAVADRELSKKELIDLYRIGNKLGLSAATVDSLLSLHSYVYEGRTTNQNRSGYSQSRRPRYSSSLSQAYKVLELNESATDSEVKKAYRKLVVIYHPDKITHMGEQFQKSAKEKFQKIQDAYEQIKSARNIK